VAPKVVDCTIKKLPSKGITTAGEFKAHIQEAKNLAIACGKELGLK
jgi:hypothetical protein